MRALEKPVARVFRRLRFQRILVALVWCWTIGLAAVAVAIGVEKLFHRALPGPDWMPFAVAGGVGVVIAFLVGWFTGPSRLDAAVAIDRAFHLSERTSSALTLPDELRETPAGRALLADAARKIAELDVTAEFALRPPRRAWIVLVPAALCALLMVAPEWSRARARAVTGARTDTKALAKQSKALSKKIAHQRSVIDKEKFPEAERILAQIQKKTEELAKAPPAAKDKLMVELNSLSNALKEREKQLGSPDRINRQLKQLKDMAASGPADQFLKDLARADFQKAEQELKKLQEKLKAGKMTEAEKQELKQQLKEMAKKLNDLANLDKRKKQLEEARKNGGLSQQQYEREMEKLREQAKGLQQMQKLAQQLSQAQQALQKGDAKKAAEAMGTSREQLQAMAKQLEEMEALDSAMADIEDIKNGMSGDGMNQLGEGLDNMPGNMMGRQRGQGTGLGRGRGQGDRPEAPDDTATYRAKVNNQFVKGKAVLQGFTKPGKAVKGQTVIDVQAELNAAEGSYADALSNQRIPKNLEKHVRSYYDQLNKGE